MFDKQIKVIFQFNFTLSRKAHCLQFAEFLWNEALPNELNWNQMVSYMINGELPDSPVTYQRCVTTMYPETLKLIRTPRSFKVDTEGTLILRYDLNAEEVRKLELGVQDHKWALGEGEFPLKRGEILSIVGID